MGKQSVGKWSRSVSAGYDPAMVVAGGGPRSGIDASQARIKLISWAKLDGGGPWASAKYFRPIRTELSHNCLSTAVMAFRVEIECEVIKYF